jgi:CRP-like cAMP-binding protein
MGQHPASAALRRVALFSACGDEELELIDSSLTRVAVEVAASLCEQGGSVRRFFVIFEGYARVCRDGDQLGIVGPGSFVGEMALLNRRPPSASVTAITPMTMCVLEEEQFLALIDRVPCVAEKVRRTAMDRTEVPNAGRQGI